MALAIALGLATACASLGQSLWLDELHTSWSATGPWSEVSRRAALGNQLPLYFGGLWLLCWTFGASEWVLRLPSLLAWLVTLAVLIILLSRLAVRSQTRLQLPSERAIRLWPLIVLLALDRSQIFFATEARPYALLSLVNLLAWCVLDRIRGTHESQVTPTTYRLAGWFTLLTCLDALAFWIQPTAILHMAAQAVCVVVFIVWKKDRRLLALALASGVLLVVLMWPAWSVLLPVWQHRQQWASFASDTSLAAVMRLMPLASLLLPATVAVVIQFVLRRWMRRQAAEDGKPQTSARANIDAPMVLWLSAGCLPLVFAVFLAAFDIAPLAHQRYLVASVPPLLVASGIMLSQIRWSGARAIAMVIMLGTMIQGQDDLPRWYESVRQARWPAVVRGEDWRGAVRWIVEHSDSNAGSRPLDIFCASMLIEGNPTTITSTLTPDQRDYLAFPLKSLYAPSPESRITPLTNAPSSWQAAVQQNSLARADVPRWLIIRISARALPSRLEASGLETIGEPKSFGGVQVVRLP